MRGFRLTGSFALTVALALGAAAQSQAPDKKSEQARASKAAPKSDAVIQKCITEKIAASSKLKNQAITVSVSNAEASLIGAVKSEKDKRSVAKTAKQCGAKAVNNALTLAVPKPKTS